MQKNKFCIFCKIIAGELPASVVYRDNNVIIFMDIAPFTRGHCLVVPIEHSHDVHGLQPAARDLLFRYAAAVAKALKAEPLGKTKPAGVNYLLNEGKDAMQTVPHVHLHVIPRYKGSKLGFVAGVARSYLAMATGGKLGQAKRPQLDADAEQLGRLLTEELPALI